MSIGVVLLPRRPVGRLEEPPREESESRARGNSPGCLRLPRPTQTRARGHQAEATSARRPVPFSSAAGGQHGHELLKRKSFRWMRGRDRKPGRADERGSEGAAPPPATPPPPGLL